MTAMVSGRVALDQLKEGNARYVSDVHFYEGYSFEKRREELIDGQSPIAVILGCADARAPAELIFDQGLGDLFVVRVAGNVAASTQIASIEYAVSELGTRLVVVLGHSDCGAVKASINEFQAPSGRLTPSLKKLVERIQPAVKAALKNPSDEEDLVGKVVRTNITETVAVLKRESSLLETLVANDGLMIVGAEYSINTGIVEFLVN